MNGELDGLLAAYARRIGAWRVWLVRGSVGDVVSAMEPAVGVPVVVEPVLGDSPLAVPNLRDRARETWGKALYVVDASPATSAICAPIKLGAPACVERLDVALGQPGCGLAVVGVGRKCRWRESLAVALDGLVASPEHAPLVWQPALVSARLEGLDERMHAACDLAQELANYLACHPRVSQVRYPGLRDDPSYETAASQLHHGFGPLVDYLPHGVGEWRRLDALGTGEPHALDEAIARLEAELAA